MGDLISAIKSKGDGRIPELDGIRGVAITLVLLFHYFYVPVVVTGRLEAHILAPLRIAWTGVDLFFVLSGFLIGGILLDVRTSLNYFATFYVRRFYRIVPLYAAVLFAGYLVTKGFEYGYSTRHGWTIENRLPWLSYVFFAQNIWMGVRDTLGVAGLSATWSLAVEEQFYLTLPLLIRLVEPRRLLKVLAAAIIAAPLLRTFLLFKWPGHYYLPFVLMPCRADALLLGVVAAIAMRTPTWRAWIETHGRVMMASIFALLCGCVQLLHRAAGLTDPWMQTIGYTWMALLYVFVLMYAISQKSSLVGRVCRWRVLRSLGEIAYGTYLLHLPMLLILTAWITPSHPMMNTLPALNSWPQFGITIIALFLTIGLCRISWRYFEKPLMHVGHRSKYEFDRVEPTPQIQMSYSSSKTGA
jgi:peptidoglycan/LPS O-acetylase OafA/YrhL